MRCFACSWQNGRTCSVHLPCPDPHISCGNTHGEQPAVLHQPTHLVHVGSLSASHFYGSPLARPDWGHLCPSQWGPPDWASPWISPSLDWRSRIWDPISEQHSTFHVPESAIYHAPELPWGTSQLKHASINREKVRLASCSIFLIHSRVSSSYICRYIAFA